MGAFVPSIATGLVNSRATPAINMVARASAFLSRASLQSRALIDHHASRPPSRGGELTLPADDEVCEQDVLDCLDEFLSSNKRHARVNTSGPVALREMVRQFETCETRGCVSPYTKPAISYPE